MRKGIEPTIHLLSHLLRHQPEPGRSNNLMLFEKPWEFQKPLERGANWSHCSLVQVERALIRKPANLPAVCL